MERSGSQLERQHTVDLLAVIVLSLAGMLMAILDTQALLPLRFAVGVFLALFAPGYALVSILFPDNEETTEGNPSAGTRVVLAIALSAVLVPLVVLALQYSGVGIRRVPLAVGLFVLTVLLALVAVARRARLPPEHRFAVPTVSIDRAELSRGVAELSIVDKILYGGLVLAILVTAVGAGYAFVTPAQDGTTEFYLLAENRTGELAASDYPTEFGVNQSESVVVGVSNQEGQSETYTVVVQLQQTTERSSNPDVVGTTEISRFTAQAESGQTVQREVTITPRTAGTNQRVLFELYRGEPQRERPYRELYLWINVTSETPPQSFNQPVDSFAS